MKKLLPIILIMVLTSCKSNLDYALEHGEKALKESHTALSLNGHKDAIPHLEKFVEEQRITVKYLEKWADDPGWLTPSYQVIQVRGQIESLNQNIVATEEIIVQRKSIVAQ